MSSRPFNRGSASYKLEVFMLGNWNFSGMDQVPIAEAGPGKVFKGPTLSPPN